MAVNYWKLTLIDYSWWITYVLVAGFTPEDTHPNNWYAGAD